MPAIAQYIPSHCQYSLATYSYFFLQIMSTILAFFPDLNANIRELFNFIDDSTQTLVCGAD